ncbi:hypothetical protein AB0D11_27475 [Streptomyces monashensis]|uniref:hypothetical protein n=1 Tax=Streptomyces monashensis TaxID=1678012 RepID=UPI0033DB43E8
MSGFHTSASTPTEERLWHAFPTGALVDVCSHPDDDPGQAASWPRTRDIRAEAIAALLTRRRSDGRSRRSGAARGPRPVESGVDLSGVTASGTVRLNSTRIIRPLTLSSARLGTHCDLRGRRRVLARQAAPGRLRP